MNAWNSHKAVVMIRQTINQICKRRDMPALERALKYWEQAETARAEKHRSKTA